VERCFEEVHASTHIEVCNEVDKTLALDTALELSYEADYTSDYDGHVACTHDDYGDYDGPCVESSLAQSSSTETQLSMAAII
jgi:hypothetical protein